MVKAHTRISREKSSVHSDITLTEAYTLLSCKKCQRKVQKGAFDLKLSHSPSRHAHNN